MNVSPITGTPAERSFGVAKAVVFELQQLAELILIEFFDALLDVLRQHKIQECLQLAVVACAVRSRALRG